MQNFTSKEWIAIKVQKWFLLKLVILILNGVILCPNHVGVPPRLVPHQLYLKAIQHKGGKKFHSGSALLIITSILVNPDNGPTSDGCPRNKITALYPSSPVNQGRDHKKHRYSEQPLVGQTIGRRYLRDIVHMTREATTPLTS